MTTLVVLLLIAGLIIGFLVAVALERGPSVGDLAVAYERAWDDLDFDLLYDLSGEELRDGMRRDRFVRVKRAAHERAGTPARLGTRIEVETAIAGNEAALVSEANGKVGAFALAPGSRDAALLISLPPGAYTAQLSGASGGTGTGLIEVYEVP